MVEAQRAVAQVELFAGDPVHELPVEVHQTLVVVLGREDERGVAGQQRRHVPVQVHPLPADVEVGAAARHPRDDVVGADRHRTAQDAAHLGPTDADLGVADRGVAVEELAAGLLGGPLLGAVHHGQVTRRRLRIDAGHLEAHRLARASAGTWASYVSVTVHRPRAGHPNLTVQLVMWIR
ncbi:hypothetical protein QP157_20270 [Sphingomonas sp. LR61]|uniref:hypothetical protein n=1 Tax=Sphingomonas sp. LR61 TaxID=3050234 RepID=UPI002FE062EE